MDRKIYLLAFLALFLLSTAVYGQAGEERKKVKIDEDTIELEVSPAMRDKIMKAFREGRMYEENGVTVVELDEKSRQGILNEGDDAIVLAPPNDRSTQKNLSETLKSAISVGGHETEIVSRIAQSSAQLMTKAFLTVLPLAVRLGYGLDLLSDGVARSVTGRRQRTAAEREKLWQEYVQWEMKIQKSGRSLQYMVVEYDEYIDGAVPPPPPTPVAEVPPAAPEAPPAIVQAPEVQPVLVLPPPPPVVAEVPQQVVYVNNVVQTTYSGGRRHIRMGRRALIRPKGHRVRHRIHYLPGIRREHHRRKRNAARPVVIRRARPTHHRAQTIKQRPVRHRPKVVLHTKSYRPPKQVHKKRR